MLVLRVAVVVIEIGIGSEFEFAKQARVNELGQRSVNGRPADVSPGGLEILDKLFGREMMMLRENMLHEIALLPGEPLWARSTGEVLAELVFRSLRHLNGGKRQRSNSSR